MEERLNKAFGKDPGFKIPEGYFDSFYKEMSDQLPPYKPMPEVLPISKWQRVKPYLYLAAMFAGIWMMMKVFYTASQNATLTRQIRREAENFRRADTLRPSRLTPPGVETPFGRRSPKQKTAKGGLLFW